MPTRRIIRNAIQMDALPGLTATTKTTKTKRKPGAPRKSRAGARRPMPAAVYKPLPGETEEARNARLRAEFYAALLADGIPPWLGDPFGKEHQFALTTHKRQWKMDLAWPTERIFVEIEGYGHQLGDRYYSDMMKYNTAATLGWLLIRVSYEMLADGRGVTFVKEVFAYRRATAAA